MSPPRLTLVSNNERVNASETDTPSDEALDAEIAASLADAKTTLPPQVASMAAEAQRQKIRIVEALLFAAKEPLDASTIAGALPEGEDVAAIIEDLRAQYAPRGVNLVNVAGKWALRTAEDLSFLMQKYAQDERRLSKAALEMLAIIAYHQPVTRAEIEDIRGVSTSAGTLDILLETGWVRPRGRRRAPGKPITYGTTDAFLSHFGLASVKDLPGLADLKSAGLLDSTLPPGFTVPEPTDVAALMPDELPLEAEADEEVEMVLDESSGDDEEAEKPAT